MSQPNNEAMTKNTSVSMVFPRIGVGPQNGWFIMENPIKIDDLGGPPLFSETSKHTFSQGTFVSRSGLLATRWKSIGTGSGSVVTCAGAHDIDCHSKASPSSTAGDLQARISTYCDCCIGACILSTAGDLQGLVCICCDRCKLACTISLAFQAAWRCSPCEDDVGRRTSVSSQTLHRVVGRDVCIPAKIIKIRRKLARRAACSYSHTATTKNAAATHISTAIL